MAAAATTLFNGALFARLMQSFNELQCVKNNPNIATCVPVFALIVTFFITFMATTLSLMTCPLHLSMDNTHMNMTEFCYNVVFNVQAQHSEV